MAVVFFDLHITIDIVIMYKNILDKYRIFLSFEANFAYDLGTYIKKFFFNLRNLYIYALETIQIFTIFVLSG